MKEGYGKLALDNHDIVRIMKDVGKEYENKTPGIKWVSPPEKLLLNIERQDLEIIAVLLSLTRKPRGGLAGNQGLTLRKE